MQISIVEAKERVQSVGVINGFSYPFTKCLLKRLQEMLETCEQNCDLTDDDEWPQSPSEEGSHLINLTGEAEAIVRHLKAQLLLQYEVYEATEQGQMTLDHLRRLIAAATKFIAIFEPTEKEQAFHIESI